MVDPSSIEALTACCLIPLNKNPGIRPIGIGEVLRRIIGKSISWVLRDEIQEAAGPLQVATGFNAGAKAAIHAMRTIFAQDSTEAVILIDASNAFNSLNRRVALHNIQITCPPFSTIMINTYRQPSRIIVLGASDIFSAEGITQGDNLAMPFYALGTSILLYQLRQTTPNVKQIWLADDATGAGTIQQLKEWWDTVIDLNNKFGYYVNQLKSWIIVKNDEDLEKAKATFENDGINFTKDGKRHLGAAIGSDQFKTYYASKKVDEWCDEIEVLSNFAKSQPQAPYAAFCHGQQHKFSYLMQTIPGMEKVLLPLDEKIDNTFLSSVLNETITEKEREVYSLPVRLGGLGMPIISEKAKNELAASLEITAPLTDIIISQENKLPDAASVNLIRTNVDKRNKELLASKVKHIEDTSTPEINRAIAQASEKGASSWINVIPLEENGFNLTKGEFRDAISIRYNKRLRNLPSKCPCGSTFDITHALNCTRGGYVVMRHNNIRDFEANLLRKLHSDVKTEPELQPITTERLRGLSNDQCKPDIRARGVWRYAQNAYFDIRVTNINSESQKHLPIKTILMKHEKEKKRSYNSRIMNVEHGTFTPLVFSVLGAEGPETSTFHRYIATKIASKTEETFEKVLSLIRCKLSFLILKSALMCIRGSRPFDRETVTIDDFFLSCDAARL